jgi:LysR family transcriptional regulator, glycine cleavage system transcriptional activator
MSDHLPPLTALRAFDAAARHMSFARAAAELHVTPAALSFQIKSLEDHLGVPVFRRLNRQVELTQAGRTLASGTQGAFETLAKSWAATRRLQNTSSLTITAGPALTAKWLAPRMYDFARSHPGIELRFAAGLGFADLERDGVDVAIRFSAEEPKDLWSEPLMREWMTPMVSPALAQKLKTPADLASLPLIHQDNPTIHRPVICWKVWFRAMGLGTPPLGGPRFSQADHAVDSAVAGGGVVLGRISVASQALAAGSLVAPFPLSIYTFGSYRLMCLNSARNSPNVSALIDWLHQEAARIDVFREGRDFRDAEEVI